MHLDDKKKIIIISNYAPDEIYLSTELKILKEEYSVLLFRKEDQAYNNVRVKREPGIDVIEVPKMKMRSLRFIVYLFLSLSRKETILELKFLFQKRKPSIRLIKRLLCMAAISHIDTLYIRKAISQKKIIVSDAIIYSYRLNSGALTAINLKRIFGGEKCIGRAHGIDLYEYRDSEDYLPFRRCIMKNLNDIYTISLDGYEYLFNRYPNVYNKFHVARLGTIDYGIEAFSSNAELSIISCSRVEEIKRLDRVVQALSKIDNVDIKWMHIGGGSLLQEIRTLSESLLPPNIRAQFVGNIENSEVYEIYRKNSFDIFVNVSYDEGLPVAIMEASSFGIPVIATDVGGTSEIVENGYNGWLIPRDYDDATLSNLFLYYYKMNEEEKLTLRKNARNKWKKEFNQESNYRKFVKMIK